MERTINSFWEYCFRYGKYSKIKTFLSSSKRKIKNGTINPTLKRSKIVLKKDIINRNKTLSLSLSVNINKTFLVIEFILISKC